MGGIGLNECFAKKCSFTFAFRHFDDMPSAFMQALI